MYIITTIHNNSLGKTFLVDSKSRGKQIIKAWAQGQFNRQLTAEEENRLENNLEIYNEEDSDNIYCFSLGLVEKW